MELPVPRLVAILDHYESVCSSSILLKGKRTEGKMSGLSEFQGHESTASFVELLNMKSKFMYIICSVYVYIHIRTQRGLK